MAFLFFPIWVQGSAWQPFQLPEPHYKEGLKQGIHLRVRSQIGYQMFLVTS